MRQPIIHPPGWLLLIVALAGPCQAQPLVWVDSLDTARVTASRQGKLILLVAGRLSCPDCVYVKQQVCESALVRPIVDEACVAWFADISATEDWRPYRDGLSSFALPLACIIDPRTTNAWMARRTGLCNASTFRSFLLAALRSRPPQPDNLVDRQVLDASPYWVTGHIWTNAQPAGVFYRVTRGTDVAGPFVGATGTTDWIAALAPYVIAGVPNLYSLELYAEFEDDPPSATNRLVFLYQPAGPPPPEPEIGFIGVSDRVVSLTLTNLALGVMVRLERSLNLGRMNEWLLVTNFVSPTWTAEVRESIDPAWRRAFYRVSSAR